MEHVAGLSTQQDVASVEPQAEISSQDTASLTVLGALADREPPVPCYIQSIQGTRMQLRVTQPIAPDAPVRVESHDSLWLGTAEQCLGVPDDYILTLHLSHCLRNLPELARLAERFRGRPARHEALPGTLDWNP